MHKGCAISKDNHRMQVGEDTIEAIDELPRLEDIDAAKDVDLQVRMSAALDGRVANACKHAWCSILPSQKDAALQGITDATHAQAARRVWLQRYIALGQFLRAVPPCSLLPRRSCCRRRRC